MEFHVCITIVIFIFVATSTQYCIVPLISATLREAYVQYTVALNRQLDLHSYKTSDAEVIRPLKINKPTMCMRVGSLDFCMRWVQWQIVFGPHAEWYAEQRRKRRLPD